MSRRSGMASSIVEPLDEAEQTKILDELKTQATNQTVQFRKIFRYVFVTIALILFVCLCRSLLSPWEMNHQTHFKEHIPHWFFTIFYVGAVYCYGCAALIVENGSAYFIPKVIGYYVAVLLMFGWLFVFYHLGVTHPALYWMPFVSIAGMLLATYVDYDSNSLIASAEGLDKYKYSLKGV